MYSYTQHTLNTCSDASGNQIKHTQRTSKLNRNIEANRDQSTHPQSNVKGAQDLDLPELLMVNGTQEWGPESSDHVTQTISPQDDQKSKKALAGENRVLVV